MAESPASSVELANLREKFIDLTNSLFQDGFLNNQFTQLQMLQDASNPEFVSEVITLFWEDSERLLMELTKELHKDPVDYRKVRAYVHQFEGSSSSVGARRLEALCVDFRGYAESKNGKGCLQSLQSIKEELSLNKHKLDSLLKRSRLLQPVGHLQWSIKQSCLPNAVNDASKR
ncbi:hypothetical protein KP509_10G030700 [Ceratopteris richardii]|uniref:Histidine-containing phosphotransfer protein n=1 Tax=Ceratopteris richardii TaxID=49495 RepID=A0A8T2TZV3_CERRI|nr:hypothetical protein KP509_10G030700 [Ceratopteris richardii]